MAYNDQEVLRLLRGYQRERSPKVRAAIVAQMGSLVEHVARKFAGTEPLEDLKSEGFLGLLQAVEQFDPERGVKFSTYATHLIGGRIRHYLRDRGHMIRQPAWVQEQAHRMEQAIAALEQSLHRQPSAAEIARRMKVTEEVVEDLLNARQRAQVLPVDAAGPDDDWAALDADKLGDLRQTGLLLPVEDRILIEETMAQLTERERRILYYFFYQELNQSEIARLLGISCNYVGYLLRKGLGKLRHLLQPGAETLLPTGLPELETGGVIDRESGLYTAAYFRERLAEEVSRSQRHQRALSVCRLFFSTGLAAEPFEAAGQAVRSRLRRSDVAARTGGREIGIILIETGAVALRVAERLGRLAQQAADSPVGAGAATYPEDGRSPAELIEAARAPAPPPGPLAEATAGG